jgi:hypothetical protein
MIIEGSQVLLYIEPKQGKSAQPVVDRLYIAYESELARVILKSRKQMNRGAPNSELVYGTLDHHIGGFTRGSSWMGKHMCACGDTSDAYDYLLPGGLYTNLLSAHYLKWHRSEVPQVELDKVLAFVTANSRYYKDPPVDAPIEPKCKACGAKIE